MVRLVQGHSPAKLGSMATALVAADTAILDRRMSGRTGDGVTRTIRRSHPTSTVIVVSAFQPDEATATDLDCDRYIAKPIQRADLIGAIETETSV